MTTTAIATDVHQSLDVHPFPTAEVTLYLVVAFDNFTELGHLSVGEVFYADAGVDASFRDDFIGSCGTNSKDITQTDFHTLVAGEVHSSNSRHCAIS